MVLEESIMKDIRTYIKHFILEMHQDQNVMIPPPPPETIEELNQVINQYHNRLNPNSLQYDLDERMELLFNDVVQEYYGDNVIAKVKELKKHLKPIIDQLKKYFKRERPEEVAAMLGINWNSDSVDMNTINNSYSYPSGHAAQAYYVALNLCDKYPKAKNGLIDVAEAVAQSRIDRGVHFPSDLHAGRSLASKMYHKNKNNHVMTEAMKAPSSVSFDFAIWTDLPDLSMVESAAGEFNFVLYSTDKALNNFKITVDNTEEGDIVEFSDFQDSIMGSAVAVMRVRATYDKGTEFGESCNGAWEVIRSAAEGGYGPTLYDMIMSIAPYGLMSDRDQVSNSARSVWSKYANQRNDINKSFLDGYEITATEDDDCSTHGGRVGPLQDLTRINAVNFFKDNYPLEFETYEKEIDSAKLMDWGSLRGDDFYEKVSGWMEENAEEFIESGDFDQYSGKETMDDEWNDWRWDTEPELIDLKQDDFEDPDYLNLTYNTDYAFGDFEKCWNNHFDLLQEIEVDLDVPDFYNGFAADYTDAVTFAVRDYFNDKYN
jgi:hypothetical protein